MVVSFNKQSVSWNFRSRLFCRVLEGSTVSLRNIPKFTMLKCIKVSVRFRF